MAPEARQGTAWARASAAIRPCGAHAGGIKDLLDAQRAACRAEAFGVADAPVQEPREGARVTSRLPAITWQLCPPESARSRARRRRVADAPPIRPPSGGRSGRWLAALTRRHRSARAAGDASSACRGVSGVRGVRGPAVVGRGVVVRSRCGPLALVPVSARSGARGGRETATVRAPRWLGGGSKWAGAGLVVVAGRARAGWDGVGASQGPP